MVLLMFVGLCLALLFNSAGTVEAGAPAPSLLPTLQAVQVAPGTPEAMVTAAEIIEAVNALRLSRGLHGLSVHPILMEAAAAQAQALALSGGAVGHARPCGLTLGQDLLRRGYPLAGDLRLDGFRSENWAAASTAEDAIQKWLMDEPHTNTMLAEQRSDLGAGVAVGDQVYVVLITALRTGSGQMQQAAFPILTAIPATLTACQGGTSAGQSGASEYIRPVRVSTPLPNGDVIHEVQYGQNLWSIAMAYGVAIEQIRLLNRLPMTPIIYPGQMLLIRRQATPTVLPPMTAPPAVLPSAMMATPSPLSPPPTASTLAPSPREFVEQNGLALGIIGLSFLVLLIGLGIGAKRR